MKTPKKINGLELLACCCDINISKWNKYMNNTTKANCSIIEKHIKEYLPELYDSLGLKFYNPYRYQSYKKEALFIYTHSAIEYFIKYY